jgi:hypothetical protein
MGHAAQHPPPDPAVGQTDPVRTVVATIAHPPPDAAPLRLEVGDEVEVGERSAEWPEFVLVTAGSGTGWVPARHLSTPTGHAVVETPYDTTELPTAEGDRLQVVAEDLTSGWLWCRAADGREGWVPVNTLADAP